jgi:hypothetical protein
MRLGLVLVVALGGGIPVVQSARAQTGPVIVIPGKAGVPVTINGMIVDHAVVYGDWGLARPGHGQLVIEGPVGFTANWDSRGYFPATGHRPRYGRHEIEPPQRRRANGTFYREWSIESEFQRPVTAYPPVNPPAVILAPRREHR